MSPPPLVADLSAKEHRILAEFRFGDPAAPSFARYSNWDSPIAFGGGEFAPTPTMAVELPKQTGSLSDSPPRVVLPEDAFTLRLSSSEPVETVRLRLVELLRGLDGSSVEPVVRYRGRLALAVRNYQGRPGAVLLEGQTPQDRLESALGIPAIGQCVWPFAGAACGVSPAGLAASGTLVSAALAVATISGLPSKPEGYWKRGYVSRAGLRIMVTSWSIADPSTFVLARVPPSNWIGAAVSVFPGCDKSPTVCANRWNNLARFSGAGVAMLDYDPTTETPK